MLLRIKLVKGSAEILSDKGGEKLKEGDTFEVETRYISLADLTQVGPGGVVPDPGVLPTTERDLALRRELGLREEPLPQARTVDNDMRLPGETQERGVDEPPLAEGETEEQQRERLAAEEAAREEQPPEEQPSSRRGRRR